MWIVDLPTVVFPLAGMGVNLLGLAIILRLSRRIGFVQAAIFAFVWGLIGLLMLEAIGNSELSAGHPAGWVLLGGDFLTYACLGFSFFSLTNTSESSIRVRILREIDRAGGSIDKSEFSKIYNEDIILKLRLERWRSKGLVVKTADRYALNSKGLRAVERIFYYLKIFLVRRSSQFD